MCIDNTVYLPSFPMTTMSLLDLEYATISPKLWERKAKAENLSPCLTRTIDTSFNRGSSMVRPRAYLIPGGRFLVLLQNGHLALWDLGYVSDSDHWMTESARTPIARIETEASSYAVHPSPDGLSIRIATYGIYSGIISR